MNKFGDVAALTLQDVDGQIGAVCVLPKLVSFS